MHAHKLAKHHVSHTAVHVFFYLCRSLVTIFCPVKSPSYYSTKIKMREPHCLLFAGIKFRCINGSTMNKDSRCSSCLIFVQNLIFLKFPTKLCLIYLGTSTVGLYFGPEKGLKRETMTDFFSSPKKHHNMWEPDGCLKTKKNLLLPGCFEHIFKADSRNKSEGGGGEEERWPATAKEL